MKRKSEDGSHERMERKSGVQGFLQAHKTVLAIVGVVVLLIAIVIGIVVGNQQEPIPDDYFASDETKLVLSMLADISSFEEDEEYEPNITHVVYYHDVESDEVSNVKVYFQYENEAAAEEADKHIRMDNKSWATGRRRNGKYIVFSVKGEQYRGLSVGDVSDNISTMDAAGGLIKD